MSNAIALDTHAAIKRLIDAGFTERQAEAEVSIIADLVEERLATKRDLAELETRMKSEIEVLKRDLTIRLGGMMAGSVAVMAVLVKLL